MPNERDERGSGRYKDFIDIPENPKKLPRHNIINSLNSLHNPYSYNWEARFDSLERNKPLKVKVYPS